MAREERDREKEQAMLEYEVLNKLKLKLIVIDPYCVGGRLLYILHNIIILCAWKHTYTSRCESCDVHI